MTHSSLSSTDPDQLAQRHLWPSLLVLACAVAACYLLGALAAYMAIEA